MSKFRKSKQRRQDGPKRKSSGSSIRGKISAPIPIVNVNDLPLSTPGAEVASVIGHDGTEKGLETGDLENAEANPLTQENGIVVVNSIDHQVQDQFLQMPTRPAPEAPAPVTYETSSFRSSTPSRPNGEKAQRKSSGLKSVFGRLFGRKKKVELKDQRVGQHRSDPTALKRSSNGSGNAQARSASMPITEFNRALRSHSVLLEDFPIYEQQKEPKRDSIVAEGQRRPRRATTPSRLWTPNKGAAANGNWTGLSPRPASSHARDSWNADVDVNAPIGMAVTSGSHPNRRSRSHGELREAMQAHPLPRRRSDEIRYWRESYDPGFMSPISSTKAETEDPATGDEALPNGEPHEEPQPFNFGLMGEMAGMKITQAANLETRVRRLEGRLADMERSVSRIRYRESSGTIVLQEAPRRSSHKSRSVSATRPQTQDSESSLPSQPRYRASAQQQQQPGAEDYSSQNRSSSYDSSRLSTKITNISYKPSHENISPDRLVPDSASPIHIRSSPNSTRPLSTSTTIRGFTSSSSPPTSKDGSLTIEHYTALVNMILAEQAARKRLEALVLSLQQQIQPSYPRSPGKTLFPMSGTVLKVDPPNDHEHHSVCGEFSSFEQDDSSDDDGGRYMREEFQTPNEVSRRFEDDVGVFGNGDADAEGDGSELGNREREPRTLSLSQITLGTGAGRI